MDRFAGGKSAVLRCLGGAIPAGVETTKGDNNVPRYHL